MHLRGEVVQSKFGEKRLKWTYYIARLRKVPSLRQHRCISKQIQLHAKKPASFEAGEQGRYMTPQTPT
jgi:hypothetical protein